MADGKMPSPDDLQKLVQSAGRVAILGGPKASPAAASAIPALARRGCGNCFFNPNGMIDAECQLEPRQAQLVMVPQQVPGGMTMVGQLHMPPRKPDPAYCCSHHLYGAEHRGELVQAWDWNDPAPVTPKIISG